MPLGALSSQHVLGSLSQDRASLPAPVWLPAGSSTASLNKSGPCTSSQGHRVDSPLLQLLQAEQGRCPYPWVQSILLSGRDRVSGSSARALMEGGGRRRLRACPADAVSPRPPAEGLKHLPCLFCREACEPGRSKLHKQVNETGARKQPKRYCDQRSKQRTRLSLVIAF